MEFRVVPPIIKKLNSYGYVEIYEIAVKVLKIHLDEKLGEIIPITIERLDFNTGKIIICRGITFQSSIEKFKSLELSVPFYTYCDVSKYNDEIQFKVFGKYSPDFNEKMFFATTTEQINEETLNKIFRKNYFEFKNWFNKL